jgi:hypothetical protein
VKGYTNINDTTPSITITVLYSNIPRHATGTTTGAWVQVTSLAGIPIQRLDVIGTKDSSTAQVGAALIDDITITTKTTLRGETPSICVPGVCLISSSPRDLSSA